MAYVIDRFDTSFLQRATDTDTFIDKTDFIAFLNNEIDCGDQYVYITRPCGFGKTFTISMLAHYYSKKAHSTELFEKFKIAKDSSFKEHLHKYHVIDLDMNKEYAQAGESIKPRSP